MKAVEILQKLIDVAYWWSGRQNPSQLRRGETDSKPGDMLKKLSAEDRALLSDLKSEDISEDKVTEHSRDMVVLMSNYYDEQKYTQDLKDAKINFDMIIKK